jgi:hypothetical protein
VQGWSARCRCAAGKFVFFIIYNCVLTQHDTIYTCIYYKISIVVEAILPWVLLARGARCCCC